MTLAVLALVIKVAIPAGFMLGAQTDSAPAIVLCTAQGAVTIKPHGQHEKSPTKSAHDSPCAFAGHGATFVASEPVSIDAAEAIAYAPSAPRLVAEAVPGQGLAAPPLPARGPPQVA